MLRKLQATVKNLWNRLPDGLRRVIHTAWQVAISTLVVNLSLVHSTKDVKSLLVVVGAAVLAAVKAAVVRG